eukprot:COSAG01_NODE_2000_length_8686_cov_3.000116_1_plen_60_part_10
MTIFQLGNGCMASGGVWIGVSSCKLVYLVTDRRRRRRAPHACGWLAGPPVYYQISHLARE